jgi:hypothetical protein
MELFSSLGGIAVGLGLATGFGANSEPDIHHDDNDEEERKMFVGGLPQDVRQDSSMSVGSSSRLELNTSFELI